MKTPNLRHDIMKPPITALFIRLQYLAVELMRWRYHVPCERAISALTPRIATWPVPSLATQLDDAYTSTMLGQMRPYLPASTRAILAMNQTSDERGERRWPVRANVSYHQLISLHYPRIRYNAPYRMYTRHTSFWLENATTPGLLHPSGNARLRHGRWAPPATSPER